MNCAAGESATMPSRRASEVPINSVACISLDAPTLPAAWSIVPAVSGQMVWVDNSYVYFKPSTSLLPNTKYTVTISTAVQDLHGSRPTAPFTFAFVTRPE